MTERRPRLLDLFCGAGGAAMGYHRAGFEVVGVDIAPQPHYPFEFHQADAMTWSLGGYDAIHASPPCQGYSRLRHLPWLKDREYPLLIAPVRAMIEAAGLPWVIENVEGAPLGGGLGAFTICGWALGLPLYRHRLFECSEFIMPPMHRKHPVVISPGRMLNSRYSRASGGVAGVFPYGVTEGVERSFGTLIVNATPGHMAGGNAPHVKEAMGIDWMTRDELTQAIPPAYTEWIGEQLLAHLARAEGTIGDGQSPTSLSSDAPQPASDSIGAFRL